MIKQCGFYTALSLLLIFAAALPRAHAMGTTGGQKQPAAQKQQEKTAGQQIRALIYHHVGREDKYPSTSVSVAQFKKQLAYLKKNDFTVLTLGRALDRLYGKGRLGEKTAVITIDDGYRSVWENARPLLNQYGYPATLFIASGHVGGENYLTWEEIQKLQSQGFEIGNHSHSHDYFLNAPKGRIKKAFESDLKEANEAFHKHLGDAPDLYAYPFGEYTPQMMAVLKAHGYRAAAAQRSGVIYSGSPRFALPRFPMNFHYADMDGFSEKMRMNPLPVAEAVPESPLVDGSNPPELKLRVAPGEINPAGLQCFVGGRKNCRMKTTQKKDALIVTVRAKAKLTGRRSLYTITAPSADGSQWFWYSHLWVIPEISEN